MANKWGELVGRELEPESWAECLSLLLSSGGSETIYRGHRSFNWELQSKLERVLLKHAEEFDRHRYDVMQSMVVDRETDEWTASVEKYLTRYFRRNAIRYGTPGLPEPWDVVGWWEVMQHHGAPTRLMDWTTSPFVALWFAIDGHEDRAGDMALWIYDRRNGLISHGQAQIDADEAEDIDFLASDDRRAVNRFRAEWIEQYNSQRLHRLDLVPSGRPVYKGSVRDSYPSSGRWQRWPWRAGCGT